MPLQWVGSILALAGRITITAILAVFHGSWE